MENLHDYLPILIPLIVLQLGLMIAALVHIFRHKSYRMGNRILWGIISIFISIIGPVLYFTLGRSEE
ncbi:PLDc N-terminal domain-containing protein [Enterococcus wangshanyuanii]|uniref:Cardiolipin synthase N-terminal domain-containing protein n=1 Tax=Enterococcus wangshanyuanii TaxID=2005703 RepID=A0ABQ1NM20_9ENTE|nr:PLDc N-terminal domain-containing protein [Enterococcus wangshanyuanii]GGC80309.1 hypothetical protein GCM10011573_07470 [Enterococcus wangshanyuanii]